MEDMSLLASSIAIMCNLAVIKNIPVSRGHMTLEVVFVFRLVWTIRTLELWCLATFQPHMSKQIASPIVNFATSGAWKGSRPNRRATTMLKVSPLVISTTSILKMWCKLVTVKFLFHKNWL